VTYMSITQDGVNLMTSIFPEHANSIESIMSSLSTEEQDQAIELVRKLGLSVKSLS